METILLASAAGVGLLAAANGANDASRAAATLLGGGVASYRSAIVWVVCWTLCGSLASIVLAAGVAHRFADFVNAQAGSAVAIGVAPLGALLFVVCATYRRLPVSTTHAILGSLVGIALASGGLSAVPWKMLVSGFFVPLIGSPIVAFLLAGILALAARLLARLHLRLSAKALDRAHWVSCGLLAFSRGVNDSAKIWALIIPAGALAGAAPTTTIRIGVLTVALAMLLGGALGGRRVTETLAFRIKPMGHADSAIANISTAATILAASFLALPAASSHVVTGAILGTGLAERHARITWAKLAEVAAAWVLTLPVAALASAGFLAVGIGVQDGRAFAVAGVLGLGLAAGALVRWRPAGGSARAQPLAERLIVFVCASNTSRSPMAERICDALLAGIAPSGATGRMRAISRGLSARGEAMTDGATDALAAHAMGATGHVSSDLAAQDVDAAEIVFCMTEEQQLQARQRFPQHADKIQRLDPARDIANPAGGDASVYGKVFEALQSAVAARLQSLRALPPATA